MAKNFTLQDDEKFCIFVTKDKSYHFNNVLHQVFIGCYRNGLEFLILDCNI